MIPLKALAIWFLILVLAVLNGGLREAVLLPQLGQFTAYIVSGLFLCAVIFLVTWALLPRLGRLRSGELVAVGLGWLCLTLVFEFSLGLYQGKSWPEMFAAYRFEGGNLWPLALLVTAVGPWLAGKLRGWV